jgi:hypothetical protein
VTSFPRFLPASRALLCPLGELLVPFPSFPISIVYCYLYSSLYDCTYAMDVCRLVHELLLLLPLLPAGHTHAHAHHTEIQRHQAVVDISDDLIASLFLRQKFSSSSVFSFSVNAPLNFYLCSWFLCNARTRPRFISTHTHTTHYEHVAAAACSLATHASITRHSALLIPVAIFVSPQTRATIFSFVSQVCLHQIRFRVARSLFHATIRTVAQWPACCSSIPCLFLSSIIFLYIQICFYCLSTNSNAIILYMQVY